MHAVNLTLKLNGVNYGYSKSNSIALRIKQWMSSRIQAIINAGNGSMPDTDMCQEGLLLLTEI